MKTPQSTQVGATAVSSTALHSRGTGWPLQTLRGAKRCRGRRFVLEPIDFCATHTRAVQCKSPKPLDDRPGGRMRARRCKHACHTCAVWFASGCRSAPANSHQITEVARLQQRRHLVRPQFLRPPCRGERNNAAHSQRMSSLTFGLIVIRQNDCQACTA